MPSTNIPVKRLIGQQQGQTKLSFDASIINPTSASSSSTLAPSTTHIYENAHKTNTQSKQKLN
jgi:hypothetical protein